MIPLASLHEATRLVKAVVEHQRPILLVGPAGSGKTTLIRSLATQYNKIEASAFLRIQVNEGIDAKVIYAYILMHK